MISRACFVILLIISPCLHATESIKVGMTSALTGPSASLGKNMRAGIESYFSTVNSQGGINGRMLEFIVKDDGYEPNRAATNMRTLIDDDKVLAVIGNVGTPTAIVTVPIAQEKKTLLFGAFSGGSVLRPNPASRYVINYRASYDQETAEIINGLLQAGIKPEQIAFFTQADSYGDTAYRGAINALHKAGFIKTEQLIHGRYIRNTLNVENAGADVLDATIQPTVIIMAAGYRASSKYIHLVKEDIADMIFVNLSFVGSYALQKMLAVNTNADNVIVSQVVPSLDSSLPIVEEYKVALQRFNPELQPNFVSFEGFIVAKIFHYGLMNIEKNITKENIIDGIESIRGVDIGLGELIYYDQYEHQAINKIWLTCMCHEQLKQFDWRQLTKNNFIEME
jgi:ABC-type branched-subunit amino acid transport system substrate-binding protein